jgi:hypothetical protein
MVRGKIQRQINRKRTTCKVVHDAWNANVTARFVSGCDASRGDGADWGVDYDRSSGAGGV